MPTRVLIVDDHPVVQEGLRTFLELQEDLEVVGHAGTAGEALALASGLAPDLVLLDLQLPDRSGLSIIDDLLAIDPPPRVVILTSFVEDDNVRQALRHGATGFLAKHAPPDSILAGIRTAAAGGTPLDPAATRALADTTPDPLASLTPREREILEHIAKGMSNRRIGEALFITEKTVKTHVSAVLAKLGVDDRTQAAIYAKERGL